MDFDDGGEDDLDVLDPCPHCDRCGLCGLSGRTDGSCNDNVLGHNRTVHMLVERIPRGPFRDFVDIVFSMDRDLFPVLMADYFGGTDAHRGRYLTLANDQRIHWQRWLAKKWLRTEGPYASEIDLRLAAGERLVDILFAPGLPRP